MTAKPKREYDVGRGKPPKHTQFKHGNKAAKGRNKGTKNLKTDLREELSELMNVSENGKVFKLTKQRALLKGLLARAIQGDARSAQSIITLAVKLLEAELVDETTALSAEDQGILEEYIRRQMAKGQRKKGG